MQQVRIFSGDPAKDLETQINSWLAEAQPIILFMTQSTSPHGTVITFYYDEPRPGTSDAELDEASGLTSEADLPY